MTTIFIVVPFQFRREMSKTSVVPAQTRSTPFRDRCPELPRIPAAQARARTPRDHLAAPVAASKGISTRPPRHTPADLIAWRDAKVHALALPDAASKPAGTAFGPANVLFVSVSSYLQGPAGGPGRSARSCPSRARPGSRSGPRNGIPSPGWPSRAPSSLLPLRRCRRAHSTRSRAGAGIVESPTRGSPTGSGDTTSRRSPDSRRCLQTPPPYDAYPRILRATQWRCGGIWNAWLRTQIRRAGGMSPTCAVLR